MIGRRTVHFSVLLFWLACGFATRAADGDGFPEPTRSGIEFFERRIRPVLIDKCYQCHSAQAEKVEGGLRLDSRESIRQGGTNGPLCIPGEPAQSRLIQVIRSGDPKVQMPPKGALPPPVIADFETWIRMGAPDPREAGRSNPAFQARAATNHWSFLPIKDPVIPEAKNKGWIRDSLDNFILARFEKNDLHPPAAAEKQVLLRRATFDLIGLPPSPEAIDAFVADNSADAFAKVVDRLLDSPQFGERWGRYWLGPTRYADSGGLELGAFYENAWRYRDYVVSAFAKDKPYTAFLREQLAGDLLLAETEEESREYVIATGFLVIGSRLFSEARLEKLILDVADEQIDVTTRVFLGLTVTCARCHDHKSDPISTRDYYALAGIFTSTDTVSGGLRGRRAELTHWLERSLASPQQLQEYEEFEAQLADLREQLKEARELRIAFPGEIDSAKLAGVVVDNLSAEVIGNWKESNYSTNFVDKDYLHDANAEKGRKSVRFVPDLPKAGLYEVLVSYTPRANRATNVPVTVTYRDGTKTVFLDQTKTPTVDKVFASVGAFDFEMGAGGSVSISNEGTKGFVVADAVRFRPVEKPDLVANEPVRNTEDEASAETPFLSYRQLEQKILELRAKQPVLPQAMAVQDGRIRDGRIRIRGDPENLGEPVPRGFLSALGTPRSTACAITDENSGRLELANWIAHRDNPLTARVAVNRIWLHLFGQGLVGTPDDFGALGEKPSHPELLDHLARRFMTNGWSFKKLIRSILLSSTYQMSSHAHLSPSEDDARREPLPGRNLRQLDPAAARDAILVLSGQLDSTVGGTALPTNRAARYGLRDLRALQSSSRRRSLYLPVVRGETAPVLGMFEGALPRSTSLKTPAGASGQGFSLTNSQFVLEQSRRWADSLLNSALANDEERVVRAFKQAFGRPPTAEESARAIQLLEKSQANKRRSDVEARERKRAAWADLCRGWLTSSEFLTLE